MRAYREGHTPGQELELELQVTSKLLLKVIEIFLKFFWYFCLAPYLIVLIIMVWVSPSCKKFVLL